MVYPFPATCGEGADAKRYPLNMKGSFIMSSDAVGYRGQSDAEPEADIKILIEYFRNPNTDEWSVRLSSEGMTRGYENEQTVELLEEVLENIQAGAIGFDT